MVGAGLKRYLNCGSARPSPKFATMTEDILPWVPEAFLARFPVSSLLLRRSGRRPLADPDATRARKKSLVPRVNISLLLV